MKLKCHRCEHDWDYKGKKDLNTEYPVYVKCPKCFTSVNVKKQLKKKE